MAKRIEQNRTENFREEEYPKLNEALEEGYEVKHIDIVTLPGNPMSFASVFRLVLSTSTSISTSTGKPAF